MTIRKSKYFPESNLAHTLLDGLYGVEIGGSMHNAFGVNAVNVDYTADMQTVFKQAEIALCGEAMPVDVVAEGDQLPFKDKSFDFVISSHVIEHFYDPIRAIEEWLRVATKYVFIICPLPDADPGDAGKPLTSLEELSERHKSHGSRSENRGHWTRWTPESFALMCKAMSWEIAAQLPVDDKVGNGFACVLRASQPEWKLKAFQPGRKIVCQLSNGNACIEKQVAVTRQYHAKSCERFGYDYVMHRQSYIPPSSNPYWNKVHFLRDLVLHGATDIVWLDADTYWLGEHSLEPEFETIGMHYQANSSVFNAGVIFLRGEQSKLLAILNRWLAEPDDGHGWGDNWAIQKLIDNGTIEVSRLSDSWNDHPSNKDGSIIVGWHGVENRHIHMQAYLTNLFQGHSITHQNRLPQSASL